MPSVESPPLPQTVFDTIDQRLREASNPLAFKALIKGIKVPKRKPADINAELQQHIDELVRSGRIFATPSGKNEEARYWYKDEQQLLTDTALAKAIEPCTLVELNKTLKQSSPGVDPNYLDRLLRSLIAESQLHEHPPLKGKTSRFGTNPPPPPVPPLEREVNAKAVEKLLADCRKLLAKIGVQPVDLIDFLSSRLEGEVPSSNKPIPAFKAPVETMNSAPKNNAILEELILKLLPEKTLWSIADLRNRMPIEFQNHEFDAAVIRLAEAERVILSQDIHPAKITPAERARFIQDGENLLTTISGRN